MKIIKSLKLAHLLFFTALITCTLTFLFKIYSEKTYQIPIAKKKFQTKTYHLALQDGIDLSIKDSDAQALQINCKIFNITTNHWIIYLNKKIGVVDVNLLVENLSKIIKNKHYSSFLWKLIRLVEIGRVIRFDAVNIEARHGEIVFNGEKMVDDNYVILFTYLVDSLVVE